MWPCSGCKRRHPQFESTKGARHWREMEKPEGNAVVCAVQYTCKDGQREVGLAYLARRRREDSSDDKTWSLGLYQFLDTDQVRQLLEF